MSRATRTPVSRTDAALAAAVFGTVLLAVMPAPPGWDVYAIRFSGLLIAAALWVAAALLGALRVPARADRAFLIALGALGATVVVSTSLGYAPTEMLAYGNGYYGGASTWLVWLLIAGLASLVRPDAGLGRGLLWAQLPVGAVALVALFDGVRGASYLAGFENSNHLAPGLIVACMVSVGLSRTAKDRRWRITSAATALLAGCAVLASRSASGILGLFVAAALMVIFAPRLLGVPERMRMRVRVAGTGVSAILVAFVGVLAASANVAESLGAARLREEFVGGSLLSRLFFWGAAWRSALDRPLLGLGADGFEAAVQRALDGSPGAQVALGVVHDWAPVAGDPHSLVLTVLASFGFVGLLAACAVGFAWAYRLRQLRARQAWSNLRSAMTLGLVGWFVAMIFLPLSVQWGGYLAMVFGLVLAEDAPGARAHSGPRATATRARLARAFGVVLAAVLLLGAGSVLVGNYWFHRASSTDDARSALEYLAHAQAAQPASVYYEVTALDVRGQALDGSAQALQRYHAEVDGSSAAVRGDVRYLAMLVRASLDEAYATGREDLSWESRYLAELTALAPMLPEVTIERAHLALLQGDQPLAQELLIEVKPYESTLARTALYRLYYARLVRNTQAESELKAVVERQNVPERLFRR